MDPRPSRCESAGINLDCCDELGKHGNVTRVHMAQTEWRYILNEGRKKGEKTQRHAGEKANWCTDVIYSQWQFFPLPSLPVNCNKRHSWNGLMCRAGGRCLRPAVQRLSDAISMWLIFSSSQSSEHTHGRKRGRRRRRIKRGRKTSITRPDRQFRVSMRERKKINMHSGTHYEALQH